MWRRRELRAQHDDQLVFGTRLDDTGVRSGLNGISGIASKAMGGVATAVKGIGVAAGTAVAGISVLVKQATDAYAETEQLIGGVETLFGAQGMSLEEYAQSVGQTVDEASEAYNNLITAQENVLENASKAWQTAGMSANEYMETVTSFSASLLQSLEGDSVKASEVADMAIIDMSDNANKMGTSMEAIQNAYNGFAKQNYTMLDNLKLGYGGTKSEMERLLADAQELTGVEYNIDNLSDVYEAIHAVQTEIGITGTTAKEASETISGSVGSMSAAWSNLVAGLADDNADFDSLVDNFVNSADTMLNNMMPRIQKGINGVGKLITTLLPKVLSKLPALVNEILPDMVDAAINVLFALQEGIISAIPIIVELAPTLLDAFLNLIDNLLIGLFKLVRDLDITELFNSIVELFTEWTEPLIVDLLDLIAIIIEKMADSLPTVISGLSQVIVEVVKFLTDPIMLNKLIQAGLDLILALVDGLFLALPTILESLPTIIDNVVYALMLALPKLAEAGMLLFGALVDNLPAIIEIILKVIPDIILNIVEELLKDDNLYKIIQCGIELFIALVSATGEIIAKIIEIIPEIIDEIVADFKTRWPDIKQAGLDLFEKLCDLGEEYWGYLKGFCEEIIRKIVEGVKGLVDDIKSIGEFIVDGIKDGITSKWNGLIDDVKNKGKELIEGVKEVFDINSPSKEFAYIGKMCVAGFDDGAEDLFADSQADAFVNRINASLDVQGANSNNSFVIQNNVSLEGEARGIFKVVDKQNTILSRALNYRPLNV
ncbi:MAG: hypothetical protein MJZ20_07730 [Bacteroidaceae bacterium]|nr:hypothetical protein [Bacteroidaceae bacterium]